MEPMHTNNILGLFVKDDTIFTVVITITVFIVGILIQRIINWYDKNKRFKDVENLLWSFVILLENYVTLMVDSMNNFSNEIKQNKVQNIAVNNIIDFVIIGIKNLPSIDLYEALIIRKKHKNKQKLFASIFSGIEFIEQAEKTFKNDVIYTKESGDKYYEIYRSSLLAIGKWYDYTVNQNQETYLDNDFFIRFRELYGMFLEENRNNDLEWTKEKFLLPLNNNINNNPTDRNAFELIASVNDAIYAIINYQHLTKTISEKIKDDAENIKKYYCESKNALAEILQKKNKKLFVKNCI